MNFYICEIKRYIHLFCGKLSVYTFLTVVVIISFFVTSSIFQNHLQLAFSQNNQTILLNDSNYFSRDDISNTLIEQFKEIILEHSLSRDASNISAVFNSSISVPIVVGIVTPNGTSFWIWKHIKFQLHKS